VFIPPSPRDILQQQITDLDRQIDSLKSLRDSLRRRLSECYPMPPIIWPIAIAPKPVPFAPPSIADVIKSIK
jgi:hypothetical protein